MKKISIGIVCMILSIAHVSAQWVTSGTHIYSSNTGKVGIDVSTPLTKLHVNGFAAFASNVTSASATRALNLIDVDAVMRVLRVHPTSAPAVELISRTSADGANVAYWDFYAEPTYASFRIRDRKNGSSNLDRLTIYC